MDPEKELDLIDEAGRGEADSMLPHFMKPLAAGESTPADAASEKMTS